MNKTEEKKYSRKFLYFFHQKLQFTYVRTKGEVFSPPRRPSSTLKMRFINFLLCLWVILALLDPDPDCESGSGYGSRDPIESGSGSTALVGGYGTQSIWLINLVFQSRVCRLNAKVRSLRLRDTEHSFIVYRIFFEKKVNGVINDKKIELRLSCVRSIFSYIFVNLLLLTTFCLIILRDGSRGSCGIGYNDFNNLVTPTR
jgi:hypothetical protein